MDAYDLLQICELKIATEFSGNSDVNSCLLLQHFEFSALHGMWETIFQSGLSLRRQADVPKVRLPALKPAHTSFDDDAATIARHVLSQAQNIPE
jgi:hypothetical protein